MSDRANLNCTYVKGRRPKEVECKIVMAPDVAVPPSVASASPGNSVGRPEAGAATIVKYETGPLRTVENTGFEKMYMNLPPSSQTNLESYLKTINDAQRQRLFQAFNKITEDNKKKQALVTFAELTAERRNAVIQQLTNAPSKNLLELVTYTGRGGRKTRTSHKRHKASKKTRRAQ